MEDATQKDTQDVLECASKGHEFLEQNAFDILNLADKINNCVDKAKTIFDVLEKNGTIEEKKEAFSCLKESLNSIEVISSLLSEKVHDSEKELANQRECIEQIIQIIDFLYCPWE